MTNKIGKYELIRKIATGGMAEVFLARSEWARGLEKTVVVKRILYHLAEDPAFIDMFFTEAQLASQLSHPNIAQIIEFGESEGIYYLAMEYVDGPSLRALSSIAWREDGGLPLPHSARIAAFCCEALAHAHDLRDQESGELLNLVHRDVSPDNILVSKTGAVKLVDFGIAKATTQSHKTRTGLVKGKLAYMPPEQLRAEPLDRRADVFSLGVVLYELVTGSKPFEGPNEITLIHAMLYDDMTPVRARRPDVPRELERIINKALERDRERRYPDCRAMHADLEEYLLSARHPISALQVAELVEKYRPLLVQADHVLATPNRQASSAETPESWRAERTPAADATAQIRKPLARTGTGGSGERAAIPAGPALEPGSVAPLDRTDVIPTPVSTPHMEVAPGAVPRPIRRSGKRPVPAPKPSRRVWVVLAEVGGVALAAALLVLRGGSLSQPRHEIAPAAPVVEPSSVIDAGASGTAKPEPAAVPAPASPPPEVTQAPALPPRDRRTSPAHPPRPMVKLILDSVPKGDFSVFVGKQPPKRGSAGPFRVEVSAGEVEVEVSGHVGKQPFRRRDKLTLDSSPEHPYTITVEKGFLNLQSHQGAKVSVDDLFFSDEVPVTFELYQGPHLVRFQCDARDCAGLPDKQITVEVLPNKTVRQGNEWP